MQKHIQQSFIENFPKNRSVPNERTLSQSPSHSRNPPRTSPFHDAMEKKPIAATLSGTDQFLFQNLRPSFRRDCEEEMAKIGRDSSRPSRVFIREETSTRDAAGDSSPADLDDSITILTYSKRPYEDFRQSMQAIVEARAVSNEVVDRQFMEELLFRYLDLNNEKFYGCIVRAFLDLIVISREDSGRFPARRRSWIGGRRRLKVEIKRVRKFCQNHFMPK